MIRTRSIFMIFPALLWYCTSYAQSLEWLRESRFDTIHYPGVRHVFVQLCTDDADSVLVTGTATFLHANIKHLGECVYRQTFRDTILTKVELSVKGAEEYGRLARYFGLLTAGAYNTFTFRNKTALVAYISRNGIPLCVMLFTDRRHKRNEIVIEAVPATSNSRPATPNP